MASVAKVFWHESFWLTPGLSWDELENKPGSGIYIPQPSDMFWSVPLALVLVIFRFLFERFISTPLAGLCGIKDPKMPKVEPNEVLEDLYLQNGTTSNNNLESVAKKTDLSVRQVERWLRDRQTLSRPGKLKKFTECSWHFLFYISSFIFGLFTLWDKPWLWDTAYCWKDWPKLHTGTDIYVYYMVELAFYWSLIFTVLFDTKRKDFKEMVIHHISTITLIYFSWCANFVRIGSLVMLLHDAADSPLALGKMFKYCGYQKTCDGVFVIFLLVWTLTRLIIYPRYILYSTMFEIYELIDVPTSVIYFNVLLLVLQVLHLVWSFMIARILWRMLNNKGVTDVRSDSESD